LRGAEKIAAGKPGWYKDSMQPEEFRASLSLDGPPEGLPAPLAALWLDAKGDWARAHGLVDDLETPEGMAVHAYLHRKEGVEWNAEYWYRRAGKRFHRPELDAEWEALVEWLVAAG
jgi:hypothetical protein